MVFNVCSEDHTRASIIEHDQILEQNQIHTEPKLTEHLRHQTNNTTQCALCVGEKFGYIFTGVCELRR